MPKTRQNADTKGMRMRHRAYAGTSLVELLVSIVVTAAVVGGILGATTTSVSRIRQMNVRAIALSLCQDTIECARHSARTGIVSAGTRVQTFSNTGVLAVAGQTLSGDRSPTINVGNVGTSLRITRVISLVSGTTDIFKITATASWDPTGTSNTGRYKTSMETYMRVPCD